MAVVVKNMVTQKWVTLRSISWWFNFDPYPNGRNPRTMLQEFRRRRSAAKKWPGDSPLLIGSSARIDFEHVAHLEALACLVLAWRYELRHTEASTRTLKIAEPTMVPMPDGC